MKTEHRGFKVTELTGGLSATVRDAGGYVEILLTAPLTVADAELSFDLEGWTALVEEMQAITQLGQQVQRSNSALWIEEE